MSLQVNKIDITSLSKSGKVVKLAADEERRQFLAENTEVESVTDFEAVLRIKPWKMNGASVSGVISLTASQTCVTTLEPMETVTEIEVHRYFLPETDAFFKKQSVIDGELVIDPEAADLPDILEGRTIDIWEVVLEELNLNIDPYPRSAGFDWQNEAGEDEFGDTRKPFADLKSLITEKKSRN